jgi:hypothetical protein
LALKVLLVIEAPLAQVPKALKAFKVLKVFKVQLV